MRISTLLLATPSLALAVQRPVTRDFSALAKGESCPSDTPLSCSGSAEASCCYEAPGGILLATQFWDYYPAVGADDEFTLHGLWPDNCDGSYAQFCDNSLNIGGKSVKDIIVGEFNDQALYDKMTKVWKNYNGDDASLWLHEYNKHGTCVNTLNPKCYADYKPDENIYDFYRIAVDLYEKLPTYKFLNDAGIVPSGDATYTKSQIAAALNQNFNDKTVYFKCNKYKALQEIWYFHNVHGSVRSEDFRQIDSLLNSNCPSDGIHYYPKGWNPGSGGGGGDGDSPAPPSNPDSGYVKLSGQPGCLISNGQWYQYGTCATYSLPKSQFGGYNLKSSKGFCGFDSNNQLACGPYYEASKYQFAYDKSSRQISYGGKSDWCYSKSGQHGNGKYQQIPVKLDDGACGTTFKLTF